MVKMWSILHPDAVFVAKGKTVIACQRDLFDIPDDLAWINCAQHSPALKTVFDAGLGGLERKRHPWTLGPAQYQEDVMRARTLFAGLIGATAADISFMPSASYGLSLAAKNLTIGPGRRVVLLAEQFPSHVYPWREAVKRDGGTVVTVERPNKGSWTQAVLAEVDERCAVLALPACHWMDGRSLDLELLSKAARACGTALVLDLSQSLGAVPIDVGEIAPDFLCAVAYKWLLGPYSFGYLYSAPHRQDGQPLEHAWSSRGGADDAGSITDYRDDFLPGARRYDVGERGNYIALPMAIAGLEQVHAWGVGEISATLRPMVDTIARRAEALGLQATAAEGRAPHFLGLRFPEGPPPGLTDRLKEKQVYISQRGDSLRVSPHLYNNDADIERLFEALAATL